MSRFCRTLLGAAVVLGLTVSLLGGSTPAEAAPYPPSPHALSTSGSDGAGRVPTFRFEYRKLSKVKRTDAQAAVSIVSTSVSNKGRTLNYKKADKYDKGRTAARRQVAAAYLWAGKKVTNISKTELRKVKKYLPKKKRPRNFDARSVAEVLRVLPDANPACTGRSGWKTLRDTHGARRGWALYLNKCETANLKAASASIGFVTGVLAISMAGKPPTAAALGTVAAIAGLGAGGIDVLQDYSTTGSIWFTVVSSPIGLIITVRPQ